MRLWRRVQDVEKNFDHVGPRFAEEARKIHLGEAEKRSIYGEASTADAKELRDEGLRSADSLAAPPRRLSRPGSRARPACAQRLRTSCSNAADCARPRGAPG